MASRTRIVCLHEGERGSSIDPIFINKFVRTVRSAWIRNWGGNNVVRLNAQRGRSNLIQAFPNELKVCLSTGSDTTLMVWADCDHDMVSGDALKEKFWAAASAAQISREDFDSVIFMLAKDRLENWIQFFNTGMTDENVEGPRTRTNEEVVRAAKALAECCQKISTGTLPPSLEWSCNNWRSLVERMR